MLRIKTQDKLDNKNKLEKARADMKKLEFDGLMKETNIEEVKRDEEIANLRHTLEKLKIEERNQEIARRVDLSK